jgi:hypothetical protein
MMKPIKFMLKQFLNEPLWYKVIIIATLLISIIFSSSTFSDNGYYQSLSKLAAAIFFCTIGIKLRRNKRISTVLFILGVLCIYLSWNSLKHAI